MKYSKRFYRVNAASDRWHSFAVKVETTDLLIKTGRNSGKTTADLYKIAEAAVKNLRKELMDHISIQKSFMTSLNPIKRIDTESSIINKMYHASEIAGVGPLAGVAGAISEFVGLELLEFTDEIILENGGDIWMDIKQPVSINIYSGESGFKDNVGLKIYPENKSWGICTSSGKIGPSLSFGKADSATVISHCAITADTTATAVGNMVNSIEDVEEAVKFAMDIDEVTGVVIIYRDVMAAQGDIELINPNEY